MRWTDSILYVSAAVRGDQTVEIYSNWGLMRVLYAVDFSSCLCGLVFLLRKPMPDSHKFVHYHWIRVHINHAHAEIARVGIRYSLFQKQEKNHLHQQ